jgi:hypothetical protein
MPISVLPGSPPLRILNSKTNCAQGQITATPAQLIRHAPIKCAHFGNPHWNGADTRETIIRGRMAGARSPDYELTTLIFNRNYTFAL